MQITDLEDIDQEIYVEHDLVMLFDGFFGRLGSLKYRKTSSSFYEENGINVEKIKRLFLKTNYEDFTDYLIDIAFQFKNQLIKSKTLDKLTEERYNNLLMLKFLRRNNADDMPGHISPLKESVKNIIVDISNKTKSHFKSEDIGLILCLKEYLENYSSEACFQLDMEDFVYENATNSNDSDEVEKLKKEFLEYNKEDYDIIHDKELDKTIKKITKIRKAYQSAVKVSDIGEFVEILIFIGTFQKHEKYNPKYNSHYYSKAISGYNYKTLKNFISQNNNLIFQFLDYTGILEMMFKSRNKNIDELKSTPYNYIRSLINNTRKRRIKNKREKMI